MRKKMLYGLCAGLVAAALALLLWRAGALNRVEFASWSWRVQSAVKPGAATDRIRVILLDQGSLDWAKKEFQWPWPWPREVYSAIIAFCRRGGAHVIAFDVLFTEPSIHGVSDDEALGAAMGAQPDVLGALFLSDAAGDARSWPETSIPRLPPIRGLQAWLNTPGAADGVNTRASFPIPEVATNVTLLANVSDTPDADGIFRRVAMFKVFDGIPVFSLGCAAYLARLRQQGESVEPEISHGLLRIATHTVPIDAAGRAVLRFRGRSRTHRTFNAAEIIQSELSLQQGLEPPIKDPSVFKDCFVFVGFSAPGLLDLRPTPISKVYPGVEIHATALDNLLSGDFLRDADPRSVTVATLLAALAAALAVIFSRRAWQSVAAFALFLPIPFVAGSFAYSRGVWWPVVVQVTAVLTALIAGVVINYATEGRQKAFLKQAFRFYLNPEVIDRIIRDPSQLKLGGERRELTIFFSDLQGFSSISERLDPEGLTTLLNDFLSDMTDIVLEAGGTLDKYEGDAIIAFWNAPLGQPDHAVRACSATVRCQLRLAERADEFKARCGADLVMRAGLNTGEVVVGNMGSKQRFNYTVLGDAANLASRLEGANKAFGSRVMVSESTWKQTGGAFIGRELAQLRVVGRSAPVTVFELAGFAGDPIPAAWARFGEGLAHSYRGETREALDIFLSIPDDNPSQKYAERCRALLDQGVAWDGIWNLTEK